LEHQAGEKRESRSAYCAMKKKRKDSRKRRNAALKSLRNPSAETFEDARARYRYQHREWVMIAVRTLIRDVTKLTGKPPVSLREVWMLKEIYSRPRAIDHVKNLDQLWAKLRAKRKGEAPLAKDWLPARDRLLEQLGTAETPQAAVSRLQADFERAVIAGDFHWFERMARTLRGIGFHQTHGSKRARFEVAALCELQYAAQGMTDQDILDRLEQCKDGNRYKVEDCLFSSPKRCREAIKRLAKRKGVELAPTDKQSVPSRVKRRIVAAWLPKQASAAPQMPLERAGNQ
jgi:hypothetical protein